MKITILNITTKPTKLGGIKIKNPIANISQRTAARVLWYGILILLIAGAYLFFVLNSTLEGGIPGDAAVIAAKNIKTNKLLFGIIIATIIIMITCNMLVALTLYVLFKQVNNDLALLTAVIRLIYAIIFGFNMVFLFIEPSSFSYVFLTGQIIYTLHMLVLGYLVFKSGYIPRILGVLLIIGGSVGYLIEVLTYFVFPNYLWIASLGIVVAIVAEISLGLWLLLKGDTEMKHGGD